MRSLIFLWILSSAYRPASGLICKPILDTSQLSRTGVLDLDSPISLNGVITAKREGIPYGGVLEFLIEHEENQGDRERDGSRDREIYDASLRIEFNRDSVILSSRIGQKFFGENVFQLNSNRTEDSSLTIQLLGRLVCPSLYKYPYLIPLWVHF